MPPKGSTTRFQPPPQSLSPPPVQQDDKHDILSVVDFVDALDALPIELTKGYGDLRELDAVLHSTLVNLTEKLHLLISLVTDKTVHPSTRFQLLQEIAEEAARFKLGGDDKIRVAGGACDGIATHQKHISALLRNSSLLIPCSPTPDETRAYQTTVPQSNNKRAAASRANNSPFYQPGETPTKKKRAKPTALSALATGASMNIDDDDGLSSKARKAAKEKEREKKKKRSALGRALSPSESIASAHGTPALGSSSRHESARNPRAAAARARYADRAMSDEDEEEDDEPPLASTSKGRGTINDDARTNGHGKAKAAEHETQDQFAGRTARQRAAAAAAAAASNKRNRPDDDDDDDDEDDEPETKPLPASRKHDALDGKLHLDEDDGDVEMDSGEVDTKAYCHCGGVSYGEMIGCDDEDCEIEWYHLACINLTSTPSGTWYCPSCTARRLHSKPKSKPARRGRGGGKAGKAGKGRGD